MEAWDLKEAKQHVCSAARELSSPYADMPLDLSHHVEGGPGTKRPRHWKGDSRLL